jgi:1-deoxy-D-xylulose-5-phosphate synthase
LLQTKQPRLAILGYGVPALDALEAAHRIDSDAIDVYDARFAKPVDGDLIESLLSNSIPIITVEDHSLIGGFGSAIIEEAVRRKLDTSLITTLGLPDYWIGHGSRKEQLEEAGIDANSIATVATRILNSQPSETPVVVTS